MKHTVVLVDDHTLIAKAIANIIDGFPNYSVLYEVEHGKALMEKFRTSQTIPEIVLLDISMPVMDGFETAKWLKAKYPEVRILTLSMQDDDSSLIRMIKSGAKGYLHKNIHPEELHTALDALVSKGFYYPEWAASKVFTNLSGEQKIRSMPDTAEINERELEFLNLCCTEMTYREIAEKLNCSTRTVEGYRDSLFKKTGMKTRVGLVMYAVRSGHSHL